MEKQEITFNMMYGYKGAMCSDIHVSEDCGWIEAKNTYGEVMFSGWTNHFFKFMSDLSEGKFA